MNIYFNDLTLNAINNSNDGKRFLSRFVGDVLKPFFKKTGLKHISCNDKYRIKNMCIPYNEKGLLAQEFFTFFRSPYVDNDFSGSKEEDRYCLSTYYIYKDGIRIECNDLGCAFMKDSLSLGLPSEPYWEQIKHDVFECIREEEFKHNVLCLTMKEHLDNVCFIDWFERKFQNEPIKTQLHPDNKVINLRDDHGKDLLLEFAKRMCQSPYVIQIINSAPFQPYESRFIDKEKPFNEGIINVCLHWTEQGLGLVIKTTATNKYQAQKISEILIEEFDQ